MTLLNRGFFILLSCFFIDGNINGKENRLHTFSHPCMGTIFKVSVYSEKSRNKVEHIVEESFKIANEMDDRFSDYSAESEVSKFNEQGSGIPFKISSDLLELLSISEGLYHKTNASFEPAAGALTQLWRLSRKTKRLPDQKTLNQAIKASSFANLIVDKKNKTLTKKDHLTRLDFGGIAKGFTADKMLNYLQEHDLKSCSISAGGDIIVGDPPPGRLYWIIRINPFGDSNSETMRVKLSNAAVSTSGNVEQFIQIGGKKYSHIINPKNGLGLTTNHAAVVISNKGSMSDALATSISILGKSGLKILDHFPNTEAAIIDLNDNKVTKSPNFNKFSK